MIGNELEGGVAVRGHVLTFISRTKGT